MYHGDGVAAPVGMADDEARVQVWRPGHGWVDRPADWDAEPETTVEPGAESAA